MEQSKKLKEEIEHKVGGLSHSLGKKIAKNAPVNFKFRSKGGFWFEFGLAFCIFFSLIIWR
jgi:hypothetical protein